MIEYGIGDIIEYRDRRVRVETREENIKNDRAGFDGVCVGGADIGMDVWGYDAQITRVVSRAK